MAESVLDWPAIIAAIQEELESVLGADSANAFEAVIPGEPLGLPLGGPYCCFWYSGRGDPSEGGATLGQVMYAAEVTILAAWPVQSERFTLSALEAEIATVDTAIRRELRGNSTINSEVTDLDIPPSNVNYRTWPHGKNPGGLYRVLEMTLVLDNLEGEAIAP